MTLTWEYRIMTQIGLSFDVYEVYFDAKGKIHSWTDHAVSPYGETLEELREDYRLMSEAFNKPILDHETGKVWKPKIIKERS